MHTLCTLQVLESQQFNQLWWADRLLTTLPPSFNWSFGVISDISVHFDAQQNKSQNPSVRIPQSFFTNWYPRGMNFHRETNFVFPSNIVQRNHKLTVNWCFQIKGRSETMRPSQGSSGATTHFTLPWDYYKPCHYYIKKVNIWITVWGLVSHVEAFGKHVWFMFNPDQWWSWPYQNGRGGRTSVPCYALGDCVV